MNSCTHQGGSLKREPRTPNSSEALWSTTIGDHGAKVWVGERGNPGSPVTVRFTWQGRPVYRTLGVRIRDEHGRVLASMRDEALKIAKGSYLKPLTVGRNPIAQPPVRHLDTMTLEQAFERALELGRGMYVVDSRHRQDMIRASQPVLQALGPSFPLSSLIPFTSESIWRHVLEEALAKGSEPTGWRKAEKAVLVLYQTARWIHERSPTSVPYIVLPRTWKSELREDWEAAFACPIRDPKTLRHTREEASKLFARLSEADPRLALEIELGAELRPGQVIRSKRRQLNLGAVGAYGCGVLEVAGYGKKKGEIVHLDPERRAFIDGCMAPGGHLEKLEGAYSRGKIDDYFLFQKGRFDGGRIPLAWHFRNPGPIELSTLILLFKRFEAACGVEHVPQRSFYGLRRILTDIAPDYTGDDRALDRLTGHRDPTTRARIYQDRECEEAQEEAAIARRSMRADLSAGRLLQRRARTIRRPRQAEQPHLERVRTAVERIIGGDVPAEKLRELSAELATLHAGHGANEEHQR